MNWNDLKIFLEVSRSERLTEAAKRLGMDASTVSRRIHKLEEELSVQLFKRTTEGHKLSQDGKRLIESARYMEQNAQLALDAMQLNHGQNEGKVRLGVTEAFGNYFIAPNLLALQQNFPDIQLDLLQFARDVKISRNEAEIAIAVEKPKSTSMIVSKLTDYSLGLYASKALAEQVNANNNLEELPWVGYVDNLLFTEQLAYFKQVATNVSPQFQSTSIIGQYTAIKSGLGIGILPCFLADQDHKLVRIQAETINLIRTFWLVTHPEIKRITRVNTVWQYLKQLAERKQDLLNPS